MAGNFDGKTVVVTGAAGGIGSATARLFAEAGARVALLDLDPERIEAIASKLSQTGTQVIGLAVDIAERESCEEALRHVREHFGNCSVLVNNAGVALRDQIDDENISQTLRSTFDVNVMGLANMTLSAVPDLRKTRGCVVNLASIGSWVTANTGLSYAPSKAAVKLFTQTFAQQLAPDGIRVNAVAPGPVMTAMTLKTRENEAKSAQLLSRTLVGRYADPEEIARPILFLASPDASYITGATLPVDGGYLAT